MSEEHAASRNYTADLNPYDSGLMPFTISFLGDDEDQPWRIVCSEVNDTHQTLDELLFWNLIMGARFISEDLRERINKDWSNL
jgi:hypothetical protein